ncbi:hypothetical protein [Saccharopolyspora sp. ASAGF58]|uniref:hypothetical protein n=1 Tax=Saccharopolyspora sp. ASAGF58 TaxID=2719023 RepID=UPI00143FBBF3|nr:hypothetical protein [Saccharopolyspora sp. ASAGF58]QIZ37825.1 hypothetical protein FDZ84_28680 [Saccharopolyspora sp. ASAGF58]
MINWNPRELPDLRLRMLDFWNGASCVDWASHVMGLKESMSDHVRKETAEEVRTSVADSALFHVDAVTTVISDMDDLSVDEYGFMPWDLPAPRGFMYFTDGQEPTDPDDTDEPREPSEPDDAMPLVLTWCVYDAVEGLDFPHGIVDIFVHIPKPNVRKEVLGNPGHPTRFDAEFPDFVLVHYVTVGFAENSEDLTFHALDEAPAFVVRLLFSACHMLRHAEMTTEVPNRMSRRRHQRAGLEPPEIRVIRLRRSARPTETEEPRKVWRHRWKVREHYRRQWYPSLQAHRPKLIEEYEKGPKGAPLISGQKVYRINPD